MLKRAYKPQKTPHLNHIVKFHFDTVVPETAHRVIGYLRVSTTEQKDEGVSLDVQRERIITYCKMFQHNLIAIYCDDHTGRDMQRPGFQAALSKMVASDAIMKNGKGHPRSAGTNGRLLGHYVREQKLLSLMEALRKISLMPAQRLQRLAPAFERKGRVQVGADADLTVFDPALVQARASWAEPTLPTAGIAYVFVSGTAVIEGGEMKTGLTPGKGLRAPRR